MGPSEWAAPARPHLPLIPHYPPEEDLFTIRAPGAPCSVQPKPGGRLNKKDGLTRYGDSHVKDKTS